jgi:hypothetical protein
VVNLQPCSACRKRPAEKLSQVTWAWNPEPQTRVAYRQRLCQACFIERVMQLDKEVPQEGALACAACGIDLEHGMSPVYATAYLPGIGKYRLDIPLCEPDAQIVRNWAQENAELLAERESGSRGLESAPRPDSPLTAWERLGIVPRE